MVVSGLRDLGWEAPIARTEGIEDTVRFCANSETLRVKGTFIGAAEGEVNSK